MTDQQHESTHPEPPTQTDLEKMDALALARGTIARVDQRVAEPGAPSLGVLVSSLLIAACTIMEREDGQGAAINWLQNQLDVMRGEPEKWADAALNRIAGEVLEQRGKALRRGFE